jgi:hypothetical protein
MKAYFFGKPSARLELSEIIKALLSVFYGFPVGRDLPLKKLTEN